MDDNLPRSSALLTIQEAASILEVSTKTLRRWDKAGVLIPQRTSGNQRRYTKDQIDTFKKQKELPYGYPSALISSESSGVGGQRTEEKGQTADRTEDGKVYVNSVYSAIRLPNRGLASRIGCKIC